MLTFYLSLIDTQEDKSKFELIYNQYSKLMKHVAIKLLNDDKLAEDAVHDAFIKLINHMDDLEDIDSTKTKNLIIIITKNTAIDLYRKWVKDKAVNFSGNEEIVDLSGSSLNDYSAGEIASVLDCLPEKYSEILMLTFVHNLKPREIADLIGIKPTAVSKRLERAKKLLADNLRSGDEM